MNIVNSENIVNYPNFRKHVNDKYVSSYIPKEDAIFNIVFWSADDYNKNIYKYYWVNFAKTDITTKFLNCEHCRKLLQEKNGSLPSTDRILTMESALEKGYFELDTFYEFEEYPDAEYHFLRRSQDLDRTNFFNLHGTYCYNYELFKIWDKHREDNHEE